MKKLPVTIKDFKKIINEGYLYIDKTRDIYNLINSEYDYAFLSRPRRFGKSLTVSTMEEIFSGNKEIFKDLWIYTSDHDWKKYPIIKIDFSMIGSFDSVVFSKGIADTLDNIAKHYDVDISSYITPESKLVELLNKLYEKEKTKAVVLIDEYDVPLNRNLKNINLALQNQDILRDFFSVLKGKDTHIHRLFVTGVTKISNTSLFSGPNNIKDISLLNKFSTIVGYTQEELESYFLPYIKESSKKFIEKDITLIEAIKIWYNGFKFSEYGQKVYNPFSITNFFTDAQDKPHLDVYSFDNYWISSGTPKFLIDIASEKSNHNKLLQIINDLTDKGYITLLKSQLQSLKLESLPIDSLLFQSGYLTIDSFESGEYLLKYPNKEIEESLSKYLLASLINSDEDIVYNYAIEMRRALNSNNLTRFFEQLDSLFATVPYDYQPDFNKENIYNSTILLITKVIGFEPIPEFHTGQGKADLIFKTDKYIFVFEYKFNKSSSEEAFDQIIDKEYYRRFMHGNRRIILVGINLN